MKYLAFLRKRTNTNPVRGPHHYRAPSRIVWRVIRGMLPHKTARGAEALKRLKVFEGVPAPYDKVKRLVVPAALRVVRLRPGRKVSAVVCVGCGVMVCDVMVCDVMVLCGVWCDNTMWVCGV